jgi:hypothetical protein
MQSISPDEHKRIRDERTELVGDSNSYRSRCRTFLFIPKRYDLGRAERSQYWKHCEESKQWMSQRYISHARQFNRTPDCSMHYENRWHGGLSRGSCGKAKAVSHFDDRSMNDMVLKPELSTAFVLECYGGALSNNVGLSPNSSSRKCLRSFTNRRTICMEAVSSNWISLSRSSSNERICASG